MNIFCIGSIFECYGEQKLLKKQKNKSLRSGGIIDSTTVLVRFNSVYSGIP